MPAGLGYRPSPSGAAPREPLCPFLLPSGSACPQVPPGSGQSGTAGSRPSGVPGGVSRHEESACRGPAWRPPRLCLPGGPCARGAPEEGRARIWLASRAPLETSGQLWPSGCPSGVVWCGPWRQGRGRKSSGIDRLTGGAQRGRRTRGVSPAFCSRGSTSCPGQQPGPVLDPGTWRYSGWDGPPPGLGLLRRLHRKWRM